MSNQRREKQRRRQLEQIRRRRARRAAQIPHPHGVAVFQQAIERYLNTYPSSVLNRAPLLTQTLETFSYNRTLTRLFASCQLEVPELACKFDGNSHIRIFAECTCSDRTGEVRCAHTAALLVLVGSALQNRDSNFYREVSRLFRPAWEKTLSLLDEFLQHDLGQRPERDYRLVWRVAIWPSAPDRYLLQVTPIEQKRSKRGGWTKGRKFPIYRSMAHDSMECLDQDRKLLGELSRYASYYGSVSRGHIKHILELLEGHPLVFWDDSPQTRVTVARAEVGCTVQKYGDGLRLGLSLDGMPLDSNPIVTEQDHSLLVSADEDNNRLLYAEVGQEVVPLVTTLLESSPTFPAEGVDNLLRRLARIESRLRVNYPPDLVGEQREGDATPILQLEPLKPDGLFLCIRVRPDGNGDEFIPGAGSPRISSFENGVRSSVSRQLDEERRQAELVLERLGCPRQDVGDSWQWQVEGEESTLELLAEIQQALESDSADAKFKVEWPPNTQIRILGRLSPSNLRVEIDDRRDWFGLSGEVEVDGAKIALMSLVHAIRSKRNFVQVRPGEFARITEAFRKQLADLAEAAYPRRGHLELDATSAPVLRDLMSSRVTLKACRRWKLMFQRFESSGDLRPDPPIGLTAVLRGYQLEGYRWLSRLAAWGVGGCLADDMGLGKTVQAIAILLDRVEKGPALVVAPTSVGFNWVREIQRFAPALNPVVYREQEDRSQTIAAAAEADVVIVSYALLQRDAERFTEGKRWGTLVLDEAQNIKNSQTLTARAAREIDADWRIALTGTPLENHLGELWSLFRVISPGLFGSWDRFRDQYASPIERYKDDACRLALAQRVRPFILRRTKDQVLKELPERTEIERVVELSHTEKERYETARLQIIAQLTGLRESAAGSDHRFIVLAGLTRLRQLACHPALDDRRWSGASSKLDQLLEIVDELREEGHRALVFSQFTRLLDLVRKALDGRAIPYEYLDGKTPAARRQAAVDAFQNGSGDLFLISLKAGGTGLNLSAADYVIHLDPWWNPAVEDQATDRAHRIGQTRPVTVIRLISQDTVEQQILGLHAEKRNLVAGVLDGADRAGKLSTDELIDLIKGGGSQLQKA